MREMPHHDKGEAAKEVKWCRIFVPAINGVIRQGSESILGHCLSAMRFACSSRLQPAENDHVTSDPALG
jgi:hypothetical protein